ncbi:MAG TPA: TfpX/TfpZ family type IV pilin accessory protein [Rhodocyclaceae bacterium]|nr:TfpX/TfpZ family type IV pilin accessory protein [Rhodocyclaceae bacterium]
MTRGKAAAIHLALSAVVVVAALSVVVLLWYPGAFFRGLGGAHLVALLGTVDVCLGPLVTLIVFDTRKKSLRFDLATIACVQAIALAYGSWVLFQARPAYVVFVKDVFKVATASELEDSQLAEASRPEFAIRPLTGPRIVAARLPASREELERLMFAGATYGIDLHQLPRYYVPYGEVRSEVLAASRALDGAKGALASDRSGALAEYVKDSGRPAGSFRYLPVISRRGEMSALVDASDAAVAAILPASAD